MNSILQMCTDDCMYMEGFESMLDTWTSIVAESPQSSLFLPDPCNRGSVQIFNTYLQCHLAPPDGTRGAGGRELQNEDIDADEEDDRTKFKGQLQSIGNFKFHYFEIFHFN